MVTTRRHRAGDDSLDPRVADVLAAAAAPTEPGPLPGEAAALAAFRSAVPTPHRRTRMLPSIKAAALAATAAGALLTGGVAAAATGTLPGAAQDKAQTVLGAVGVTVPGPNAAAGDHPATRGRSAQAPGHTRPTATATAEAAAPLATTPAPVTTASPNHGQIVSDFAHTTTLTGRDKGAAISALASGGKSRAGRPHPSVTPTTTETPAAQGTAHSTAGQSTAASHRPSQSTSGATQRP